MKLHLRMPSLMEVRDANTDAENNTGYVEPRFLKGMTQATVMYLTIAGEKGTKREYLLAVSARNGGLMLQETDHTVTPPFDDLTPEAFRVKRSEARQNFKTVRAKKKPPGGQNAATPPAN